MKNFTLSRNQFDYRKLIATFVFILLSTGIILAQNANNGGSISGNQTVCPGQPLDPIVNVSLASGGDDSRAIEYLWMYGTSASFPGAGWQPASGVNNQANYTPPAVGSTTYYIRCARRNGFVEYPAESNVVTITALPNAFAQINGADNTNVFAGFTYDLSAGNSFGSTYSWDFNGDGIADCFGQNCQFTYNTPGAYNLTLRVVNSYGCSSTVSTTIMVSAPTDANIMDPCSCTNPNNLFTPTGYYNNDYILINSGPGQTWTLNNSGNTLYDIDLNPIPNGTNIPETFPGSGVYFLNVWFLQSAGGWNATATNGTFTLGTGPGPGAVCPPCPNPLPVDLTSFDGYVDGESIVLKWETATETDNDYFALEVSTDGSRFETLAEVEGAGTTSTPQFYSFTDENPVDGVNYYRLKQVDTDGNFEYFKIISFEIEKETRVFQVSPNPVVKVARIEIPDNISNEAHLELISTTGQTIKTINVNADFGVQEVMMEDVVSGVYFIRLVDRLSNDVINQKIIKQ